MNSFHLIFEALSADTRKRYGELFDQFKSLPEDDRRQVIDDVQTKFGGNIHAVLKISAVLGFILPGTITEDSADEMIDHLKYIPDQEFRLDVVDSIAAVATEDQLRRLISKCCA